MAITDDERRAVARWAADCAERVLPLFEAPAPRDARPREAVAAARRFASGEAGRSRALTRTALDAHRAGTELGGVATAAGAAARAASLAAAAANTHHETTIGTLGHVLGAAMHAALARELASGSADEELRMVIATVPAEVRALVGRLPPARPGRRRLDAIGLELDSALRVPG